MLNRFSTSLTLCLLLFATLASAQGQRGGGAGAGRAESIPSIADRTGGMKKIDGFFPLYWDEAGGRLFLEIPKLDTEVLHSTGFGTGLGSNDIGIDRGALTGSRIVKFERVGPRAADGAAELPVPRHQQQRRRKCRTSTTRSRVRCCGRFRLPAPSDGRVLVDFTDFLVRDANDIAGRLQPGSYRFEAGRSTVYMPMTDGVPEEHRDGGRADVRAPAGRPAGGGRGGGGRGGGGVLRGRRQRRGDRPKRRASACTTRSSSCPTRTTSRARIDPRAGYFGDVVRGLRRAARRADDEAVHRAPPAGEEGPEGGGQRGGQADRLLRRSGRAGADSLGARRGRALVEPGVRGGRLPQRLPGRDAARRRQPAGHPLQRHQLGAPLDARLEHRRQRHRSAHRRDHQGRRHARLAARSPGLPDRRRAARALQDRRRDAAGAARVGDRAHPPARRRTRSATRSASATTTTTATRAASR